MSNKIPGAEIMDEKVIAGLIGAAAAMLAALVGAAVAILIPRWQRAKTLLDKRHDQSQTVRDVVWQYAAPLRREVDSLKWRLEEIIQDRPATYLLPDAPKSVYVEYKRVSTLYRIAAVFGWIRALRKERSYLNPAMDAESQLIEQRINDLEKAFADGQHVELIRLNELIRLWSIPAGNHPDVKTQSALGAELDLCLDNALVNTKKERVSELDDSAQLTLCKSAAALLSQHLKVMIPDRLVEAERLRAIEYFNIREAYIYRDWQAAIGEMMMVPVSGANRRFDVMGFGEFEKRYLAGLVDASHVDRLWMSRLESIILNLDLRHTSIFDARQEQIRIVFDRVKLLWDVLNKLKGMELQKS